MQSYTFVGLPEYTSLNNHNSPVMISLNAVIEVDKESKTPVYLQIANKIILQIKKGILKPGSKLPGTRDLAKTLLVHRKTIVAALDELDAQGWIEIIPSSGTYIKESMPEVRGKKLRSRDGLPIQFAKQTGFPLIKNKFLPPPHRVKPYYLEINEGYPDVRIAPVEALSRAYRDLLKKEYYKKHLSYAGTHGNIDLRKALCEHLTETRGIRASEENILVTRGSMMALYLAIHTIIKPYDAVVVGETSYYSATAMFKNIGAKVITVPVDENGMVTIDVEKICKRQKIRAVYLTPHHHNPTTVTLKAERRMHLLSLAEEHKFAVLEDDYDFDYHYDSNPVLPLASADTHGMVIYMGSLSKSLAPAFRVGFVVAPENLIEEMARLRRVIDLQGDTVLEKAIAELFTDGEIQRHQKKATKIYHARRDYFCTLLKHRLGDVINFQVPSGGMAIWSQFDKRYHLPEIARKTREKELYLSSGRFFNPEGKNLNATRMGFASLDFDEMEEALDILEKVVRS
ncbi:MAG: PLP-dependent aminotransferase family protein [Chitinophagales bacterium]|nr:PLP-dependent aminotransferase family protein [Chitinophagales bacterium]